MSNEMTAEMTRGQSEESSALLARWRAEQAAQTDPVAQALLLHECGVLDEERGDEPAAARDYLAAFNADPQFREPLEALVRILGRRKSIKNLGKLLDALSRAAENPEERARAFRELAAFQQDYDNDLDGARDSLEEAVASLPEEATAWLELELLAAKRGDGAERMRALEARAELATCPTWKGLLMIELAELSATSGDTARAYELLDAAAALEGRARFETRVALERIAAKEQNHEAFARALEGQAELVVQALEDPAAGDGLGVPRFMRTATYAADAWLRAAEIRRDAGNLDDAAALLASAAERLPEASIIAQARIRALEAAGDQEGAAAIARHELEHRPTGSVAAALWLRVAEAAALSSDRAGALAALRGALTADPDSVPARALELDLLGDGQDAGALAASLELSVESFTTGEARGRAYLLAAHAWAAGVRDAPAAKAALVEAAAAGVAPVVVARVERMLAALAGNEAWYEESTQRLLAAGVEPDEAASLWFELGRSQLSRGETAGAIGAFTALALVGADEAVGPSAWLGRLLAVCSAALGEFGARASESSRETTPGENVSLAVAEPVDQLAAVTSDPELARGLFIVGALRSVRSGEPGLARKRLRELCESAADDAVSAIFLAELERRAGEPAQAALVLSTVAAATEDLELGAALHIEAALLLFRAGERARAIAELEAARGGAPKAAAIALSWALCGADPDSLEGRRRALDAASEASADRSVTSLERFGLEALADGGDADEALSALETAENTATGDLRVAAALARLLWPVTANVRSDVEHALRVLGDSGPEGRVLAAAERFRFARVVDEDRALASAQAAAWVNADPKLHTVIEWLGAAIGVDDREAEIAARRRIAQGLSGEAASAMEASAALIRLLDHPALPPPFVANDHAPGQLMNLELAPPGCDPRKRSAALQGLGTALGAEARVDALALAGWSLLAAGDATGALEAFRDVTEQRPKDVASWEGVRAASEALGEYVSMALACAQLGALCQQATRGATFWEQAGLTLVEHTEAHDDAEIAFERAFERDPTRGVAFDKLFRRVRSRNDDDKLLTLIARRLDVADDEDEIAKLFWERARVLRKKGDRDGALAALENVTMLEPDHVGALALAGEICITKGAFAEAAPLLARLAAHPEAPTQQRLMSGIAAVDLYENKLNESNKALEVLLKLHAAGLSTLPVRERLARTAAKTGAWAEATQILEQLMNERDKPEGRIEAARLAMAIWRDKVQQPMRAEAAADKLLELVADDGEAIDLVLTTSFDSGFRARALGRAKQTLIQALAHNPCDAERVALLAKIAEAGQDTALRQATLGSLIALGRDDRGLSEELAKIDVRVAGRPQIALDARAMAEIADPADGGPIAEMFALMAETVAAALGPSLVSVGVTKKDKIEARGGHPLRLAVAEWMGAVGFDGEWDLYVGGPDPRAVHGVSGETPAIILGTAITAPFDVAARSAIAREVFALRRGITAVRKRDANTIVCVVIAGCQEAGLSVPNPPFAMWGEISRGVHKEISRKIKKAIQEPCQRIVQSGQDAAQWADAAVRSLDRIAVIAAGDVSLTLADILRAPRDELGGLVADSARARSLLTFVLSPNYLELRKKLGMGAR
jgi:tetratricopeptide (TPR) repeat protein